VQIADVLAKAHAAAIVHGDIKPPDVIVTPEGQVKALDFELAKLTEKTTSEKSCLRKSTLVARV
jgi:serine/threonine protein kinase